MIVKIVLLLLNTGNLLSCARIVFIGIKGVRKSATIQLVFVSTTDGATQTGSALTGKGEMVMPDREKIIQGLTQCASSSECVGRDQE